MLSQKFVVLIMHRVMSVLKLGVSVMHSVSEIVESHAAGDIERMARVASTKVPAGPGRRYGYGEDHRDDGSEEEIEPKRHGG